MKNKLKKRVIIKKCEKSDTLIRTENKIKNKNE